MTATEAIAACKNKIPVQLADGTVWLVASVDDRIVGGQGVPVPNAVTLIPLQGQNDGQPKHVGESEIERYSILKPRHPARVEGFGLQFGVFFALLFVFSWVLFPSALAVPVFLFLVAFQFLLGAILTLCRTRLRLVPLGLLFGSLGVLIGGTRWLPGDWSALLALCQWACLLAGTLCFLLESRLQPAEFQAWGDRQWRSSLIDMLLMRHIPDLRRGRKDRTSG
ncbi:MAG TPA: hypothetical protein VMT52_13135 [Planctomycetota bacterium]|nr:hypothetical protein [Planctomycetota bacterium]